MNRALATALLMSLTTVLLLLPARLLHAQPAADLAAAQDLFDEGMRLIQAHDYAQACPKLEASQRLVPGVGTQFNLGDCYENTGHIASAWAHFRAAADISERRGDAARAKAARERADKLSGRLSYLTVLVSRPAPGMVVKRERIDSGAKQVGIEVPPGAWGAPLPVDAGVYAIEATAPDGERFYTRVGVDQEGTRYEVVVPPLLHERVPLRQKNSNQTRPETTQSTRKSWALVAAGVGAGALAIGAGLLISAQSTYSNSDCDPDGRCSTDGLRSRSAAIHRANWATLPVAIGAVSAFAGAWLWFTHSNPAEDHGPRVALTLSPAQCGIGGHF